MNIFQDLEGLSGENLATGGLRHLLLRSIPIRDAVLELLSQVSPIGSLLSASHFSCYPEHPTVDDQHGRGRIDLVIEVDGAVCGIETKFFASFTVKQPEKYVASLSRLAETLSTGRGRSIRHGIFVLGPGQRRREIEAKIANIASVRFVSWEALLEAIGSVAVAADPVSAQLAKEFLYYVKSALGSMLDLERQLPELLGEFPERGTDLQCQFMRSLIVGLAAPNTHLSRGADWCGYYITRDEKGLGTTWLGFVPRGRIEGADRSGALLVLASRQEWSVPEPQFKKVMPARPIELPELHGSYSAGDHHWVVTIDASWSDPDVVQKLFAPVLVGVESNRGEARILR